MNERHDSGTESTFRSIIRDHWAAFAVGAAFVLLSLFYNVTVPVWESDNEIAHFNYARYLLTNRSLPTSDTTVEVPGTADQCRSDEPIRLMGDDQLLRQPPFYYLLGAVAIAGVKVDDQFAFDINPYVMSDPARAGFNLALHTEAESFPYRGTVAALHVLRLLSGLIGLIGLVATYLSGLLVFGGRRLLASAAMGVNAFIPQYVFSSAVANNDILVGVLGSWCVYLCLRVVLTNARMWVLGLASVLAGLAIVTKYDGVIILPIIAATALFKLAQVWRIDRKQVPKTLVQIGMVAAIGAIPPLLWFGRNKLLYGSFLVGYGKLASRLNPLSWTTLRLGRAAEFAFMTFWGLFGADNIALPPTLLLMLAVPTLLAVAGVIVYILDKHQPRQIRALALSGLLFIVLAWGVIVLRALRNPEPRGRYLLPVYSIVSMLTVLGIHRLMPKPLKTPVTTGVVALLFVLSVAVPPVILEPIYTGPTLTDSAELLPGEEPYHAVFGDFAEIVGYRLDPQRLGLYEKVTVTLVWRALGETPNNYSIGVHLLDSANRSHGSLFTYPHHGTFGTSYWKTGDVFRDTYDLYLDPSASPYLPTLGRIKVAMYCHTTESDTYLDAKTADGTIIGDAVIFGRLKLAAPETPSQPPLATQPVARFGDALALESYTFSPQAPEPSQEISIETTWRALSTPAADYTLFAHIVDGNGTLVAGNDRPLADGLYPSGLWEPGEQVLHRHTVTIPQDVPNGSYRILIGLYQPESGIRLPVAAADQPSSDVVDQTALMADQLPIGDFVIDR